MTDIIGVVGTDGKTPIQATPKWTVWGIRDIYLGEAGANKYIPNVNDWVVDPEASVIYKVTDLDNITYVPELSPIEVKQSTAVDDLTSAADDDYRVYFDKSVSPYTLSVDAFCRSYNPEASYARIYRGSIVDPAKLISRRYDNSGNFVGHDIPLTLVSYNSHDNYAIKSISTCNTGTELVNGEVVSIVLYSTSGKVLRKALALVEETTYVAQAHAEQKYITQIFMKSAFIDSMLATEVHFPSNLPISSFNPIAVVQYNDGSQVEYPANAGKFRLFGLDQFVSTIPGHRVPLVLSYTMDPDEAGLATTTVEGNKIVRPYTLVVSNPNRSYNVKLFVYPVWVDQINGYRYRAYLMNLDRNMLFDVTDLVSLAVNSPAFNPLGYGITQRLIFQLDLARVNGGFNTFLHVQTVDIVLRGAPLDTSLETLWEVGSQVPSSLPYYGGGLRALRSVAQPNRVTVDSGIDTVETFIDRVYRPTVPLRNTETELEAPLPTHIGVSYNSELITTAIENFKLDFTFQNTVPLYSSVDIIFYKSTVTGYLKLAVASMTVR